MLHIAYFIQQRFPDQAPRVIKMLVTVSTIAVVGASPCFFCVKPLSGPNRDECGDWLSALW